VGFGHVLEDLLKSVGFGGPADVYGDLRNSETPVGSSVPFGDDITSIELLLSSPG
jgi:hypothetical protein